MATPPSQHLTRINAPLNFRHTDTLITTKVPHYPTKLTTGMSIIPGWNRPNANGQNANINDKDYNGPDFKPRPLKHWRRQLRVYDYKGGANNSRAAAISQLDRPGLTVYHFTPDCTCVPGEGGNSYIISNNKFGYETKDDDYSKGVIDVKIQNNGFTAVPYDATEAQINDPTNPAYKVLTGVYNTDCINCSPQGNLIKSGIAFQSQAFYSYSNDKLESRCQTYEQNLSTNKAAGCVYFDAQGIPLWPNNEPNGPQVVAPVNYGSTTYKGNFFNLYDYPIIYIYSGFVPALQKSSANFIPKIKCRPVYVKASFYVNIYSSNPETASIIALLYDNNNNNIITSSNIQSVYINPSPPNTPSYYESIITFYFPENVYINPSTTYYISFESVNNVLFNWFVVDNRALNPNYTLAGTLVAEALYCPSQTIYKPNNIGFGRQGAVSGSTRLKKLVSDTMTLNGSSFYSAKGAQEANLGKYQGTNIAGNYYVKIKEVTNSCIGTVPGAPVLTLVNNQPNTITVSWFVNSDGSCPLLYYTLTYYSEDMNTVGINTKDMNTMQVKDTNAIQVIIYPSANNVYTITNTYPDTPYNIFITATNGNGTSKNSNIVVVTSIGTNILTFKGATYDIIYVNADNEVTTPLIEIDGFTIYVVNTTTSKATFMSNKTTSSLQYLILGGGGGGVVLAGQSGGGGGAGAYILDTNSLNASTPYNISVGLGGAPSNNGEPSILQTASGIFTAAGGGNGNSGGGGCGGGACSQYGNYQIGGQGSIGGGTGQNGGSSGLPSLYYNSGSGGGGGTSTPGENSLTDANNDGNGGDGIGSDITGTATYYGGGGGGGALTEGETPGNGGVGGGGNGSSNFNAQSGTNGLGGGGGGGGNSAGSGGSGVIILRIPSFQTVNLLVTKLSNFIIHNKTYGDQHFYVSPPTSNRVGNYTFTYKGNNSTVVTVTSSGKVTIVGVGTVNITATQSATGNYSEGSITATLTVAPVTPSLSHFNIPTMILYENILNYTITPPRSNSNGAFTYYVTNQQQPENPFGNEFVFVNGNVLTINGGGTATVFANQAPAGVYGEGTISTSLTVNTTVV